MFVPELIIKKKEGKKLSKEEINFLIKGYTDGSIPDYQMSALTMAICFQGMDKEETANLTDAMMHSGDVLDLTKINGKKLDKHSTGGVGDKTSLVLGPLVSACGGTIAKLSGRGLGHTGGTLDKLESIPGVSISLSNEQFINQVNKIGIAIAGQTANLDPADKKLYALRDVTGTVNCIPLIASSIMSKKLATGSDCILLDVKYGSGAFCQTKEDAIKLATAMVDIGKSMNKDTKAIISNMDQPLGNAIGNNIEVKEAVETLLGKGPSDLRDLCLQAGSIMLVQGNIYQDEETALKALQDAIENKTGYKKFLELVQAQGGDTSYIEDLNKLEKAKYEIEIKSPVDGYVKHINTILMGDVACKLGAGRAKKEDSIDFAAGIYCYKKPGDRVNKGDVIAKLLTNHESYNDQINEIISSFEFSSQKVEPLKLIEEIIK